MQETDLLISCGMTPIRKLLVIANYLVTPHACARGKVIGLSVVVVVQIN